MTKLLEQAIDKIRTLPEERQDFAAEFLLALAAQQDEPEELDDKTVAAINEGLAQAERGEFVSDRDMADFFRRHGA